MSLNGGDTGVGWDDRGSFNFVQILILGRDPPECKMRTGSIALAADLKMNLTHGIR
jgi:hypothetical protein